jgi:hypothetical protein
MRPLFAATLILASFAAPVLAEPLTKEAADFIGEQNFLGAFQPPAQHLQQCASAEQRAAQHDRDPIYDALIAYCFAEAEARLNNKDAACNHYARAIEKYAAVPPAHPEVELHKQNLEHTRERHAELGCPGAVVVAKPVSGPLPGDVSDDIFTDMLASRTMIDPKMPRRDPKRALELCHQAEQRAAPFDRDPYADGTIALCFADAEAALENKQAACSHYARAIERFGSVPTDHRYFPNVKELGLDRAERNQAAVGC